MLRDDDPTDMAPELAIRYADEDDPAVVDGVIAWLLDLLDDPSLDLP